MSSIRVRLHARPAPSIRPPEPCKWNSRPNPNGTLIADRTCRPLCRSMSMPGAGVPTNVLLFRPTARASRWLTTRAGASGIGEAGHRFRRPGAGIERLKASDRCAQSRRFARDGDVVTPLPRKRRCNDHAGRRSHRLQRGEIALVDRARARRAAPWADYRKPPPRCRRSGNPMLLA